MRTLLAAAVLTVPTLAAGADTAPVAAEVEKGVAAYNAQAITYYEDTLATDVVYIAEDGAVFVGKERVLRLLHPHLRAAMPPKQLAVTDVVTGRKGEVSWARFKWTLTSGTESRLGVTSIIFSASATPGRCPDPEHAVRPRHVGEPPLRARPPRRRPSTDLGPRSESAGS